MHGSGEKTRFLTRLRIATQALCRLRPRPITVVPSELTLCNRGCALRRPAAAIYLIERFLKQVMRGHFMLLAAFSWSLSRRRAIVIVISDFQFQYRANAGETVEHRGNERPVKLYALQVCRVSQLLRQADSAEESWRWLHLHPPEYSNTLPSLKP